MCAGEYKDKKECAFYFEGTELSFSSIHPSMKTNVMLNNWLVIDLLSFQEISMILKYFYLRTQEQFSNSTQMSVSV